MPIGPSTSKTLLEKLHNGDAVSQTEFYYRYKEMIVSLGQLRGLAVHECEELVQNVTLRFFEKIKTFSHNPAKSRFRTWFGKNILWEIVNLQRKRRKELPLDDTEEIESAQLPPDEIFDMSYREEMRKACLNEALEKLKERISPENFRIFEHYWIKNHSARDTMKVFDISRNQLDKNKQRNIAYLKEITAEMRKLDPEIEVCRD